LNEDYDEDEHILLECDEVQSGKLFIVIVIGACLLTLTIQVVISSEISITFYQTTSNLLVYVESKLRHSGTFK
jgi:hypothetical protein